MAMMGPRSKTGGGLGPERPGGVEQRLGHLAASDPQPHPPCCLTWNDSSRSSRALEQTHLPGRGLRDSLTVSPRANGTF